MKKFIEQNSRLNLSGPKKEQPLKLQSKININLNHIKLDEDDQELLLKIFDRIKDEDNLINKFNFRIEIIGTQVPDVISERLYCAFASVVSGHSNRIQQILNQENSQTLDKSNPAVPQPDKMDFADLVVCYFTLKEKRPVELSQLCFEMLKLTKDQTHLCRDDLFHWCVRILQLNDNFINLFYKRSEFDPRVNITKKEFCNKFDKVKDIQFLALIPEIVGDYKKSYLNFDEPLNKMYNRRSTLALTSIHMDGIASNSKKMFGIEKSDIDNIREFFLEEIIGQSSDQIIRIYQKLLQDITQPDIKNFMLKQLTCFKANDFDFFSKLVGYTISKTDFKQKLSLWFDFCNNFEEMMNQENCIIFCKLFRGKPPATYPIDREDFITHFEHQELEKIESFIGARYMMLGLIGIKSSGNHMEQHQAICAVLGQNYEEDYDLDRYIQQNLQREKTCFVITKRFWDSWSQEPTKGSEVIKLIDNQQFILDGHDLRWRDDIIWNVDFIVVPKHVYRAFSKWYTCNREIEINAILKIESPIRHHLTESEIDEQKLDIQIREKVNPDTSEQHGGEAERATPLSQNHQIEMGNAMKMTNMSMMNVQQIVQETQDGQFNLQLYPRFFYFTKLGKSGEQEHKQCIYNNRIDQGYMKKYIPSNKIPFKELAVSKYTRMETILEIITATYNQTSTKKARMVINEQIITGLKLQMSPDDLKLETGTLIYVEFLNFNNTWPSETNQEQQSQDTHQIDEKKSVGLYNMGNTCYMNSALQCLANIKPFYEYYANLKWYSVQINKNNPLGHNGMLVEAFAQLIQQLWGSNQIIVPKFFRHTLGKINQSFGGDEQQDTQEYINFLIDGLHEDTNMRNDKPYIEAPNSDGKEMIELGLETWSNQIQRDWSFIYFMFYGQSQSTLECLSCKKRSTKFEVNSSIALSMPEPSKLFLNLVVHRLPSSIKQIISQASPKEESQQSYGGDSINLYKENYTRLTNDQPIYICLKVTKNIRIAELIRRITSVPEVNIDPKQYVEQGFTELLLYNKSLGKVRGLFDPSYKISNYRLITDEIHAQEVLTPKGKDFMVSMWQHNADWISKTTSDLRYLVRDYQLYGRKYQEERMTRKVQPFSMQYIINNHYAACEYYEKLLQTQKIPSHLIVIAYHRRFTHKESRIFSQMQPAFISFPVVIHVPVFPSGRRLYEEIWMMAQILLKKESPHLETNENSRKSKWWEQKDWKELMTSKEQRGSLSPFVLKYVDKQGYSCSKCNWVQKCSGCIVEPDEQCIPEFMKYCHLAIEWDSDMIEQYYNPTVNELLKHRSTEQVQIDDENQIITLESCLKKFHAVEKLQDEVNCESCKIPRVHFKSLATFRLPAILIIQLKRFRRTGGQYRKQSTTVEFPFNNLDMGPYVQDEKFLRSLGVQSKYNLFGIINHYGSLTYGHYISIVKNPFNGKWYKYDDQNRYEILESQITKENAYILFYQRKDVDKKSLSDLFPDSNVIFPGKPVTTKFGKGFVLGAKEDSSTEKTYYVKIKNDVFEVPTSAFTKNKADRFIEMCELERQNLKHTTFVDKTENQGGFFKSFENFFKSGSDKPKVKDILIEQGKLSHVEEPSIELKDDMSFRANSKSPKKESAAAPKIKQQVHTDKFDKESTTTPPQHPRHHQMLPLIPAEKDEETSVKRPVSFGGTVQDSMEDKSETRPKKKKKKKVKKLTQASETELTASHFGTMPEMQ